MDSISTSTSKIPLRSYLAEQLSFYETPEIVSAAARVYGGPLEAEQCLMANFLGLLRPALVLDDPLFRNDITLLRSLLQRFIFNPNEFELSQEQVNFVRNTMTQIAYEVLASNGPWYDFCASLSPDSAEAGDVIILELKLLLSLQVRGYVDTMRSRLCMISNPQQ